MVLKAVKETEALRRVTWMYNVLGLCCSSEVPLIVNILKPIEGVIEVTVIVPSRTVVVVHDTLLVSQLQIG